MPGTRPLMMLMGCQLVKAQPLGRLLPVGFPFTKMVPASSPIHWPVTAYFGVPLVQGGRVKR